MNLESKIFELEEEISENRKNVEKLSELQAKHEHLDEIRAVKQDQLMANIQMLVTSLKDYQSELHEMVIKNTTDIAHQDILLAKTSTRVKILYAACAVVGGAILTGVFEWLPQLIHLLSKGK
jgi:hypothetical protein